MHKPKTLGEFISEATTIHENKYDYSNVVYVNAHTKVKIICPLHGQFLQRPRAHLTNNSGCPLCAPQGRKQNIPKNTSSFIREASLLHNNRYYYSEVEYETSKTPITIICPKHGRFLQTPNAHLAQKQGCPRCQLPKGEIKISHFLTSRRFGFVIHKRFDDCRNPRTNRNLAFDFYVPTKNLLIEYDGLQHFKSGCMVNGKHTTTAEDLRGIQERDRIKTDYAKTHGIRLLRIPYKDFSRIDDILTSHLTNA